MARPFASFERGDANVNQEQPSAGLTSGLGAPSSPTVSVAAPGFIRSRPMSGASRFAASRPTLGASWRRGAEAQSTAALAAASLSDADPRHAVYERAKRPAAKPAASGSQGKTAARLPPWAGRSPVRGSVLELTADAPLVAVVKAVTAGMTGPVVVPRMEPLPPRRPPEDVPPKRRSNFLRKRAGHTSADATRAPNPSHATRAPHGLKDTDGFPRARPAAASSLPYGRTRAQQQQRLLAEYTDTVREEQSRPLTAATTAAARARRRPATQPGRPRLTATPASQGSTAQRRRRRRRRPARSNSGAGDHVSQSVARLQPLDTAPSSLRSASAAAASGSLLSASSTLATSSPPAVGPLAVKPLPISAPLSVSMKGRLVGVPISRNAVDPAAMHGHTMRAARSTAAPTNNNTRAAGAGHGGSRPSSARRPRRQVVLAAEAVVPSTGFGARRPGSPAALAAPSRPSPPLHRPPPSAGMWPPSPAPSPKPHRTASAPSRSPPRGTPAARTLPAMDLAAWGSDGDAIDPTPASPSGPWPDATGPQHGGAAMDSTTPTTPAAAGPPHANDDPEARAVGVAAAAEAELLAPVGDGDSALFASVGSAGMEAAFAPPADVQATVRRPPEGGVADVDSLTGLPDVGPDTAMSVTSANMQHFTASQSLPDTELVPPSGAVTAAPSSLLAQSTTPMATAYSCSRRNPASIVGHPRAPWALNPATVNGVVRAQLQTGALRYHNLSRQGQDPSVEPSPQLVATLGPQFAFDLV